MGLALGKFNMPFFIVIFYLINNYFIAGAIATGYSNIFVTSPSPENLKTLFEFVLKGLTDLGYEKHNDYQTLCSTDPNHNNAILRITVNKNERQIIQVFTNNIFYLSLNKIYIFICSIFSQKIMMYCIMLN